MNINDPGPHHGPGCWCVVCSSLTPTRADALQTPLADHGISPAQLREKVEALEKRIQNVDEGVSDYIDDFKKTLDAALKRIDALEAQPDKCLTCAVRERSE